ncbi:hypothetical protein LIER_02653 [Lithospermum erythrorhizon]|uniref:Pentatricopeptide repeat-containing protein n=1 Tax=Lithospermum erythrorhizon TaxID=34254 RepID=A0AAV3NRN3_LITER
MKFCNKNGIFDGLIQGICIKEKNPERAFSVLKDFLKIHDVGILPSSLTFCTLIYSFSGNMKMDKVIEVLELMSDDKFGYPFNNFVCSSVISGFVRIGKPERGIEFYKNAVNSGALKTNVVTYTSLVSAYCMLGRFNDVSGLVSLMEMDRLAFDAVFYSNWSFGCFKGGMIRDALRVYRDSVNRKVEVDTICYTILIDGFAKEGEVEKAVGFLYKMGNDGVKPNLVTYTAIMLGYCKKGKLKEAMALFKMVENIGMEMDEYIYAILIDGFCRNGEFDLAFSLLDGMEKKCIRPSIVTYNSIINGLCMAGRTCEADDISKNIDEDVITYSSLIHGYVEEGNATGVIEIKRRLKEAGVQMDLVLCNILIRALFMIGSFEEACDVYKRMNDMNLTPNLTTYCAMINGYCRSNRIDEALEIFDESRTIFSSSIICYNYIIEGLCREGMIGMAVEVFLELIRIDLPVNRPVYMKLIKSIFYGEGAERILSLILQLENCRLEVAKVICNEAICFLSKNGFSEVACNGIMAMRRRGSTVARESFYLTLRALLNDGKKMLTQQILCAFVRTYGISNIRGNKILVQYLSINKVDNALKFLTKMGMSCPVDVLKTLTKDGRVLDACKLILEADTLPPLDEYEFTVVIDGLCRGGYLDKALHLFSFLKERRVKLGIVAYNTVINGLCKKGCFFEALRLFDALERIGVLPSDVTYGTLIKALTKEGHLLDARRLVDKMLLNYLEPNTWVYNSLIHGFCKLGQVEEALDILQYLEQKSILANEFTVSTIVNGYCQKGDIEGALTFYSSFKRKGVSLDFRGFLDLSRGLYSKGRMEESRGILREMLQSPSVSDLLNKVSNEVELESAQMFLLSLCDRGSIQETISILDEVGSMFFLFKKNSGIHGGAFKVEQNEDNGR